MVENAATPLHLAARRGNLPVLHKLLSDPAVAIEVLEPREVPVEEVAPAVAHVRGVEHAVPAMDHVVVERNDHGGTSHADAQRADDRESSYSAPPHTAQYPPPPRFPRANRA